MRKPRDTVKVKILLGYFFLAGIAALTVWLIYSEILMFSDNESRMARLNNKILYFNTVLTNLYHAEALERNFAQSGNMTQFEDYEKLMDSIIVQFDSLALLSDNPVEKYHTDSIQILLDRKRKNLKELTLIKRTTPDDLYEKAMDKFNINKDSFNNLLRIRTIITDKSESTYVEQKKRSFFERLKYAFSPKEAIDSLVQINTQQFVQTDTLITEISPADSVIRLLTSIMHDIRKENEDSEIQLARKQAEVLANDQTITLKFKQMLSLFEKDVFVNSLLELNSLQNRIRMTTWYLIALGGLALVIIVVFVILILKDITRSKRYRNELETAKAYSDSLLKSKEQIMLSITHDIKSPLASVMGYARLLNETESRERREQYLANINKSGEHILKLINDLVDLTRLETGKLKFNYSSFNLYEIVYDTWAGFYPIAVSKKLDFRLDFKVGRENRYSSDPVRIKQVLGNLLSNAVKYTHNGSIDVIVSEEKTEKEEDNLVFSVKDTGIGISEEDRTTIFNEFSRVSDKYDGAGLGLSIAQRIVALLGGEISLTSRMNEGSCFTVKLPLRKDKQQEESTTAIPVSGNIKVVLIDDDEIFLDMIGELITSKGMVVRRCNSVMQAIQILDEFRPDLIITDMQMPSMNGLDMLAYVQRKSGKMIPVILLTGSDTPDTPQGEVLFSAVLRKSSNPDDLMKCIDRVTSGRGVTKPADTNDAGHTSEDSVFEYNLDQIRRFALDDNESVQRILLSFAESSYENLILFDKFLTERDRKSLSELAHKMLAMFRQLDAKSIVELLEKTEKDYNRLTEEQWLSLGRQTLKKLATFVNNFCEEQRIVI